MKGMKAGPALNTLVAERVMKNFIPAGSNPMLRDDAWLDEKGYFVWRPPQYSTDIAAAWLVVEKLLSEGWQVTLQYVANKWNCHFWRPPLDVTMTDEQIGVECIESVTEAICLAALKVKGVKL